MSEETRRPPKPLGTRLGIMYGSCKAHKRCAYGCPPFRPILFALHSPTYKLDKYVVVVLEPLTTNQYTFKDSFNFTTELVEQNSSNFIGTKDIASLFINIPLEEAIEVCTNNLFKNNNIFSCG